MIDAAPISSGHVRAHLVRNTSMNERVVFPLAIVTTVDRDDKAESVVQRPQSQWIDLQQQWDTEIQEALRKLPGQTGNLIMTMGRTFTVTWDGIRLPA